jgi:hypothetical protein
MDAPKWPEESAPAALDVAFPSALATRDSPMAVVSLVFGILCWFVLPVVGAVVAVVTGIAARREVRASKGTVGGWNLATFGLISGAAHLVLIAVVILLVVGFVAAGVGLFGMGLHNH